MSSIYKSLVSVFHFIWLVFLSISPLLIYLLFRRNTPLYEINLDNTEYTQSFLRSHKTPVIDVPWLSRSYLHNYKEFDHYDHFVYNDDVPDDCNLISRTKFNDYIDLLKVNCSKKISYHAVNKNISIPRDETKPNILYIHMETVATAQFKRYARKFYDSAASLSSHIFEFNKMNSIGKKTTTNAPAAWMIHVGSDDLEKNVKYNPEDFNELLSQMSCEELFLPEYFRKLNYSFASYDNYGEITRYDDQDIFEPLFFPHKKLVKYCPNIKSNYTSFNSYYSTLDTNSHPNLAFESASKLLRTYNNSLFVTLNLYACHYGGSGNCAREYLDVMLSKLIDGLNNTIIILAGDHGPHFGRHLEVKNFTFRTNEGSLDHSTPYLAMIIPDDLVIDINGLLRNSDKFVTLRDVHATLIDLVSHKRIETKYSRSLLHYLDDNNCEKMGVNDEVCTYRVRKQINSDDILEFLNNYVEEKINLHWARKFTKCVRMKIVKILQSELVKNGMYFRIKMNTGSEYDLVFDIKYPYKKITFNKITGTEDNEAKMIEYFNMLTCEITS